MVKLVTQNAEDVAKKAPLGEPARELLRAGLTVEQYLELLTTAEQFAAAVQFLAQALPKREAVWWACLCVRNALGAEPEPAALTALQAAEKWVADPAEANRQAALPAAEQAGYGTPAGCAAAAAFWSAGSLAPANLPAVPPPEALTGSGVAGAVLLAVVQGDPADATPTTRQFLALGIEVGRGLKPWFVVK